jgi:hypothetical protein
MLPSHRDATCDEPDSPTAEEEREDRWESECKEAFKLAENLYDILDCPNRPKSVEPEQMVALFDDLSDLLSRYKALLRK